jgi:Ca2+-binding RTX toxin-like protein
MTNRLILDGSDQTVTVAEGNDFNIIGSSAAETIVVEDGATVQFASGTDDRVEVAGNLADFTVSSAGNTLILTDAEGSSLTIALNAETTIAFSDGSTTAVMDTSGELPEVQLGGQTADETFDDTLVDLNEEDQSTAGDGGTTGEEGAPIVANGNFALSEDAAEGDAVGTVTAVDPEGDAITAFAITSGDDDGYFAIDNTGAVTLTAAGAAALDYETLSTYTLGVTATDENDNTSEAATVNVLLTDVDDTPAEATDGAVETVAGEATIIDLADYASDVDTDAADLVFTVDTDSVTNGTLVDNGDGTVTYTSAAGQSEPDSFTFTVSDGVNGDPSEGTVSITVLNDAPEAADDTAEGPAGQALNIDVLANDTDANEHDLSLVSVTSATNGTVEIEDDNTITYTPTSGWSGEDTFTYTATDGFGEETTATVTVTIEATTQGTSGDDVLGGTTAAENIDGLAGNDTINGGGGLDTITGGLGDDRIHFNQDAVQIAGGADTDTLVVAAGSDLTFDLSAANQYAGAANNSLGNPVNVAGFENIDGTDAQIMMTVSGSSADNVIIGGVDDDEIYLINDTDNGATAEGADTVYGGLGDDLITATDQADGDDFNTDDLTMYGEGGNDTLTGGAGDDLLDGGAGNDVLTSGAGKDNLIGGDGNDTFALAGNLTADDTVAGGAGTDTLDVEDTKFDATAIVEQITGIDVVDLGTQTANRTVTLDDTFVGQSDNDTVTVTADQTVGFTAQISAAGLTAANKVFLGAGGEDFNLVDGVDNVVYLADGADADNDGLVSDQTGVTIDDGTGNDTITGGNSEDNITLSGNGNNLVTGGDGNDTITAGTGNDNIDGGAGDDTFDFGADAANLTANDTLAGGTGNDTLDLGDPSGISNFTANDAGVSGIDILLGDNTGGTNGVVIDDALVSQSDNNKVTVEFADNDDATFTVNAAVSDGKIVELATVGGNAADTYTLADNVNNRVSTATIADSNNDGLTSDEAGVTVIDGATAGNDTITGGDSEDTITLKKGNNVVTGGDGDDTIEAGDGNDNIDAGAGDDEITFTAAGELGADDTVEGGAGDDTLKATLGATGAGRVSGVETVELTFTDGTPGTFDATNVTETNFEVKNGGTATDGEAMKVENMAAGSTVDIASASEDVFTFSLEDESGSDDTIDVTFSAAVGDGTNGGLVVSKDVENLDLTIGAAVDLSPASVIEANTVNVASATGNANNLDLGTLDADVSEVNASAFDGDLTVTGANTTGTAITGGDGADTLAGNATGVDTIDGGAGNDQITLNTKTDVLDGGADTDTLVVVGNVAEGTAALGVDLSVATDQITNFKGSGTQDVSNFESVDLSGYVGTGANVTGSDEANTITGTGKDDVIEAGDGADVITGGAGDDGLTGGDGADIFQFATTLVSGAAGDDAAIAASAGADTITEFVVADDQFQLDETVFGVMGDGVSGAGGTLAAAQFASVVDGSVAMNGGAISEAGGALDVTGNGAIVYVQDDQMLYFIEDGATLAAGGMDAMAAGEIELIGTITTLTGALAAADFNIVA